MKTLDEGRIGGVLEMLEVGAAANVTGKDRFQKAILEMYVVRWQ